MTKTICKKVYAQERNGEPFIIEVEVTEDNWDFQKSCYQQYELNAWGKKINGEKYETKAQSFCQNRACDICRVFRDNRYDAALKAG